MRRQVDADVLIGALDEDDAHHARARELFLTWRAAGDSVGISLVNLTEVLVAPAADAARLAQARRAIQTLEVASLAPTQAIAVEAARLRRRHPISLADGYCLATAKRTGTTLSTFDRRLEAAARREGVELA